MNLDGMQGVSLKPEDAEVVTAIVNYKNESEVAQRDRQLQNRENFDAYHLKGDFTHKKKGQSKEFLPKVAMGVEQVTSFIQQGLADLGDEWFSLDLADGVRNPKISEDVIKKLLMRQLDKADYYTGIGDTLKLGQLACLMILKVHGKYVDKPHYMTKESYDSRGKKVTKLTRSKEKVWQLALDVVSPMDFYPDPTGRGLYVMQDIEMDLFEIQQQVKSSSNPQGIYDADMVELLTGDHVNLIKDALKVRETAQNVTMSQFRKRVTVTECWGTILDADGKILHENVVCAVANGKYLIRRPEKNPFWHNENPYIVAPIIRVPRSVFHKAIMDAPVKANRALNEIYNLTLDSGLMSVFGIKQLRPDWLSDASLVDDGISPGQTLEVNSSCPPGHKVLERIDTADTLQNGVEMYNLTNAELQQAMLTNDLRLGALPNRQVKATEIVESSQSITGMLNGIAKSIESTFIKPLLEKSWMTVAQHLDDFDQDEVKKLLGEQTAAVLSAMSKEERFAETVNGLTFNVYGLTQTLNKQQDFRKITALLQTLAGDPVLMELFAQQYSMPKLLTEIMKSLNVNTEKLKLSPEDSGQAEQAMATPGQQGGNQQSQIPQAASAASGPLTTSANSIAQPKFPPSRATSGTNNGSGGGQSL
jgi:uncharacterized Zn ribbon protein